MGYKARLGYMVWVAMRPMNAATSGPPGLVMSLVLPDSIQKQIPFGVVGIGVSLEGTAKPIRLGPFETQPDETWHSIS